MSLDEDVKPIDVSFDLEDGLERPELEHPAKKKKHNHQFDRVIKLDVGGKLFLTSLETLQKAPGQLSARFSGNWRKFRQSDGCHFIDRDPRLFVFILEYIRTKIIDWSTFSTSDLIRLQQEASFFGITQLELEIENILNPPLDLSWIDTKNKYGGIHTIEGSPITFIVAKQISWDPAVNFDIPEEYEWASLATFTYYYELYKDSIERASDKNPVYPAWSVPGLGWIRYTKDGMKRLFFVFSDTASTLAYIPSAKNLVCTSVHKVWKTFSNTKEYCEDRGLNFRHCEVDERRCAILRGFAGLVCIEKSGLRKRKSPKFNNTKAFKAIQSGVDVSKG